MAVQGMEVEFKRQLEIIRGDKNRNSVILSKDEYNSIIENLKSTSGQEKRNRMNYYYLQRLEISFVLVCCLNLL